MIFKSEIEILVMLLQLHKPTQNDSVFFNHFKPSGYTGYTSKCSGPYWSNPPF